MTPLRLKTETNEQQKQGLLSGDGRRPEVRSLFMQDAEDQAVECRECFLTLIPVLPKEVSRGQAAKCPRGPVWFPP